MKRKGHPLDDIFFVKARLEKKCKIFPKQTLIGNIILTKLMGDGIPSIQPPRTFDVNYQDQVRTFLKQWNETFDVFFTENKTFPNFYGC